MRIPVVAAMCAAASVADTDAVAAQEVVPTAVYEEVARVGGPDERNPLLFFKFTDASLLDSSTVALSDHASVARVVVVDLLSGEGWDVGASELGSDRPMVFGLGDTVHVFGYDGLHHAYLRDGSLLSREPLGYEIAPREGSFGFPAGVMRGGRLAARFFGRADPSGPEVQRVAHFMLIGEDELVAFDDAAADANGSRTSISGYAVDARGDVIALADPNRSALLAFRGGIRTEIALDRLVETVQVDADGRIWARVHRAYPRVQDQGWFVFDAGGERLMSVKVSEGSFVDARGDWLLTSVGRDYASEAVLHRRVR